MKIASRYTKLDFRATFLLITIYVDFIVYFYAGIDKMLHFDNFLISLSRSPFAPIDWINEIAVGVILIELSLSLLLIIDRFREFSLAGFALLSFVFTAYIVLMLAYSPHLPCSCGGVVDFLTWNEHLLLTTYLTTTSLYAAIIYPAK